MLALERLIVGRECNGFDRLPPPRKAHAYAQLVRLGLAYGDVAPVAERAYPDVVVQRASSRGRRLLRRTRQSSRDNSRRSNKPVILVFLAIATLLGLCLYVMTRLN